MVREDSDLLNHIKVGDIFDLKYYKTDSSQFARLKTEIRHITKDDTGRFSGLYLVGLSILEDQDSELITPQRRKIVTACKKCGGSVKN